MDRSLPAPCRNGAEPNRNEIWRQLLALWLSKTNEDGSIRNQRQLADMLDVTPQSVAQWKTGSKKSPPSWCYVMRVAYEVGVVIVLDPVKGAALHTSEGVEVEAPAGEDDDQSEDLSA